MLLVSTNSMIEQMNIDYKRLELLRRLSEQNVIKITPVLLVKLQNAETVDELVAPPSTSTSFMAQTQSPTSISRKIQKRKHDEDLKMTSKRDEKCAHCGCRMLRVVDPGRSDKQRILECMRSTCLASVKFTDLPVGTVLGRESNMAGKCSYNSLARYYPKNRYSPNPDDTDYDAEDQEQSRTERNHHQSIFESSTRGIYIDVPGQEVRARFV